MNTKDLTLGIVGLVCALAATGCVGADESTTGVDAEEPTAATKLVHSLDLGNGHTVEFYDLGDGQVGTKEQYAFGDEQILDDAVAMQTDTLEDVYRYLRPDSAVPAEILAADARAAAILAQPRPLAGEPSASPVSKEAAPPVEKEVVSKSQAAVNNCSGDLFGDNWGAQWFVANHGSLWNYTCGGEFVNVNHAENLGFTRYWAGGKYVWLWKAFEGDFNVAGNYHIYRGGPGLATFITLASGTIPPRNMVSWTIKGGWDIQTNYAESRSPCGHAMVAQVWCGL